LIHLISLCFFIPLFLLFSFLSCCFLFIVVVYLLLFIY
jgi:hypothetical protein